MVADLLVPNTHRTIGNHHVNLIATRLSYYEAQRCRQTISVREESLSRWMDRPYYRISNTRMASIPRISPYHGNLGIASCLCYIAPYLPRLPLVCPRLTAPIRISGDVTCGSDVTVGNNVLGLNPDLAEVQIGHQCEQYVMNFNTVLPETVLC